MIKLNNPFIFNSEKLFLISVHFVHDVSGLVVYPDGPLNLENKPEDMSELFRPFRTLLKKIRYGCSVFSNQYKTKQVLTPLDIIKLQ